MLEARRTRLESVKPNLSLQPAEYLYGGGFGALHLVNSGGVARNAEIDVVHKKKKRAFFISSIGSGERVPVLSGSFPSERGVVRVHVKCGDSYGLRHQDELSIDFDSLETASRKIAYILSPLDLIVRKLEGIKDRLSDIESKL